MSISSEQVEEDFGRLMSISPEQAVQSNTPFIMFISFPSAKDPDWDKKYKGIKSDFFHPAFQA